jgi:hypothetical protein
VKPLIVTGSKREIAEAVARIDGTVREAIVFVDEPQSTMKNGLQNQAQNGTAVDPFAEMDPFTVRRGNIDHSRDAICNGGDGE